MDDSPLKISVSGVRGIIGGSLTPEAVIGFARAFGTYVGPGEVVVGRDTRRSGEMVHSAVVAGLLSTGCDATDIGIAPTPTTQIAVASGDAVGGVIITASHNPSEWNGLKFVRGDGIFLTAAQVDEFLNVHARGEFAVADIGGIGTLRHDAEAGSRHVARVLDVVDAERIRSAKLHVALDACNGAGCVPAQELLEALGCRCTCINCTPDGRFSRGLEPTPEHITDLCRVVGESGADVGFAQDPDADRVAIVSEEGTAIGEEYTLALGVLFVLEHTGRRGPIVVNLSTSRMVEDAAARYGCEVLRAPVGEVNVVERMLREKALLGGEGSGGLIYPAVHHGRDSLTAMGVILDGRARHRRPISELARELLPRYVMQKREAWLSENAPIGRVVDSLRDAYPDARLTHVDGLKWDWEDRWLHVRPSNTEPKIRSIAEAPTPDAAARLADEGVALIEERARDLAG
ncbi:MAG: phosphoglucosamine mutase [Armatimonadota bacterium]|jgi:phosphomannomutase